MAVDGQLAGLLVVADVIREEAMEGIQKLIDLGLHSVMLTGDNPGTWKALPATRIR